MKRKTRTNFAGIPLAGRHFARLPKALLLAAALAAGCSGPRPAEEPPVADSLRGDSLPAAAASPAEGYGVELFMNADGSWGYSVTRQGREVVNQPHIPAIAGQKGFASREQAQGVGELMAGKLEAGIMPPTVTVPELDSLGVSY